MIKVITLEGIDGGKPIEQPLEFPENELDLKNGTLLTPTDDMPWFGLITGQQFSINFDGVYIRSGGLSWSIAQLIEEIKAGYWQIVS